FRYDASLVWIPLQAPSFFQSSPQGNGPCLLQAAHSGGTSNESCSRNPRVFHTPNKIPASIQMDPTIFAERLRFSHRKKQMTKPNIGGMRFESAFRTNSPRDLWSTRRK